VKIGGSHLTYCTNIHPGESWAEVRANLEHHVLAVRQRVCPDRPFGVGLRLSNRAARELDLPELQRFLAAHELYVFTINGFPYGAFHGVPVKEAVYDPDWLHAERRAYTSLLIAILRELLPAGIRGSISTLPGTLRAGPGDAARIAAQLADVARELGDCERTSGKHIMLAIEPEPGCMLATTADAIAFFAEHVPDRRYLGICLDACHAAVEFEDVHAAVAALRAHGVPVAKVQLSCGLRIAHADAAARGELARFADGVYLHQVATRDGARYLDLPQALGAAPAPPPPPTPTPTPPDEWRVHFHVPIFRAALGAFSSTQPWLAELLAEHRRAEISTHLEVETYSWDVLPAEFRDEPIADAVARELRWVIERLA
jgi:sugar phosphate isomerase/epimerase